MSCITVFDLQHPGQSVVLPTQPGVPRWPSVPMDIGWPMALGSLLVACESGMPVTVSWHRLMSDQEGIIVAFSPDGKWLVTDHDDEYQFWAGGTSRFDHRIERSLPQVPWQPAFSPNGKMMTIAPTPFVLRLIEPATGRAWADFPSLRSKIVSVARFSPDGGKLVIRNDDHPELCGISTIEKHLKALGLASGTRPSVA